MKTLRELFRIGCGPSSSNTMGPVRAAEKFKRDNPEASSFRVSLFGRLAVAGKSYLTDQALVELFAPIPVEITWEPEFELPRHPNGMRFKALNAYGDVIVARDDYSVGGGTLLSDEGTPDVYPWSKLSEVKSFCKLNKKSYWECIFDYDENVATDFLPLVWSCMEESILAGLSVKGNIPGELGLTRKASSFAEKAKKLTGDSKSVAQIAALTYAVGEQNACGGRIVTAPTCGFCGILPSVIYYVRDEVTASIDDIVKSLATAGLFGNVIKASSALANVKIGYYGELGLACVMASVAATYLLGGNAAQIEYAATMGLENYLRTLRNTNRELFYVPCIEQNFHAACHALSCARFAMLSKTASGKSFDNAISEMSSVSVE